LAGPVQAVFKVRFEYLFLSTHVLPLLFIESGGFRNKQLDHRWIKAFL
jgi:hypothetical protein